MVRYTCVWIYKQKARRVTAGATRQPKKIGEKLLGRQTGAGSTCTYAYKYTFTYVCMYNINVCVCVCMCVCVCAHTHTHLYIHIYICTCILICICARALWEDTHNAATNAPGDPSDKLLVGKLLFSNPCSGISSRGALLLGPPCADAAPRLPPYTYTNTHVTYLYVCTCMYMYVHVCTHTYIHTYIHACWMDPTSVCVFTHTHTHAHAHTHTHRKHVEYTQEHPGRSCARVCSKGTGWVSGFRFGLGWV